MPPPTPFATLKPYNAAAKLAFHAVHESALLSERPVPKSHLFVEDEQQYDKDVLCHRLQEDRDTLQSVPDEDSDKGFSDIDSEVEQNLKEKLGMIWTGHYLFDLSKFPNDPKVGWVAGRAKKDSSADFWITTNPYRDKIKANHANFNFDRVTGTLNIIPQVPKTSSGLVKVNANVINGGEARALNQGEMMIQLGPLEYVFKYTGYARTDRYSIQRMVYLKDNLKMNVSESSFSLTPTPTPRARTYGEYTFVRLIGRGASGRVWSATDPKSRVVAIKVVTRNSKWTAAELEESITVLKDFTTLKEKENEKGRVLGLVDVFYTSGNKTYDHSLPEEVYLVLQPAVQETFRDLAVAARIRLARPIEVLTLDAMKLCHDALVGLEWIHRHGYILGDVKPANIGIHHTSKGLRAVHLDVEGAKRVNPACELDPRAQTGTTSYMPPERFINGYGCLGDIWAMGVVFHEVTYGCHPWPMQGIPWQRKRSDRSENSDLNANITALRGEFDDKYNAAMDRMCADSLRADNTRTSRISQLIPQMLRHEWASPFDSEGEEWQQSWERIDVSEALGHDCWELLPDENEESDEDEDPAELAAGANTTMAAKSPSPEHPSKRVKLSRP